MNKTIIKLEKFLAANGIDNKALSQAQFCRNAKVDKSALSTFLQGKYAGDNESLAKVINTYIDDYIKKNKDIEDFILTKDAQSVKFVCDEAIYDNEMAIIYGKPGTGKTECIKKFCQNHPESILVKANVGMTTIKLLNKIMDLLGIEVKHRSIYDKSERIKEELLKRDSFIAIDEAEHLPVKALEIIRYIHDETQTPMIYVGTDILLRNLLGKNGQLTQLYSRIRGKWNMQGLTQSDKETLFKEHKDIISKYAGNNFRRSAFLFKKAKRLSQLTSTPLGDNTIKEASKMLVL